MKKAGKLKLNIRYILVEVALIFVGISLAIQFNNWNERKKLKREEISILSTIQEDLLSDTLDIYANIQVYGFAIYRDSAILHHFVHQVKNDSAIRNYYQDMMHSVSFNYHSSAYSNLKSRGVQLISNESLRRDLVKLYEFDYVLAERSENSEFANNQHERITDYFYQYFRINEQSQIVPIDYRQLLKADNLHLAWTYSLVNKRFKRQQYIELMARVKGLVVQLDAEVKNLE